MGFEAIRSPVVPRAFPVCILIRLKGVVPGEPLLIEVDVIGPEGKTVLEAPISQRTTPKRLGDAKVSPDGTANIIVGMPGLVFPMFGEYEIRARMAGSQSTVEHAFPLKLEKVDG